MRKDPKGGYANARVIDCQKKQTRLKYVSALPPSGVLTHFIIHFQTSLVAPGQIFREQGGTFP